MASVSFVVHFTTIQTLPANSKAHPISIQGELPIGFLISLTAIGGFENVYILKFLLTPDHITKAKVKISYPSCYFYRCMDFQMVNENGWGTIFTLPSTYFGKEVILTFTFYN